MEKRLKGYQCFSVPQKDFLLNKGLEYIVIGLDPKTHKTFWLFLRDEDLSNALDEWTMNSPKRK